MLLSNYVLRLPRHTAGHYAAGCVNVEYVKGSQKLRIESDLVDLSRFGSRIRLDRMIDVGESVTLHIQDAKSSFAVLLEGNVRWCQLDDDGRWSIGCVFTEQVSWETFGELFLREFLTAEEPTTQPPAQDFSLTPNVR